MSGKEGRIPPGDENGAVSTPESDPVAQKVARRELWQYRIAVFGVPCTLIGLLLAGLQVWYAANVVAPSATETPRPTVSLEDAIALARNGRTAEAREVFAQLTAAEPKNPVVHANACGFYLESNQPVLARQACLAAVSYGPSNWLAQYNNACVLALEGRANEAVEALGRALAAAGADTAGLMTRAKLAEQAVADRMLQSLRTDGRFMKLTTSK